MYIYIYIYIILYIIFILLYSLPVRQIHNKTTEITIKSVIHNRQYKGNHYKLFANNTIDHFKKLQNMQNNRKKKHKSSTVIYSYVPKVKR